MKFTKNTEYYLLIRRDLQEYIEISKRMKKIKYCKI